MNSDKPFPANAENEDSSVSLQQDKAGGVDSVSLPAAELESLRRNQEFLMALMNSLPENIYFKDKDSRFLLVSSFMVKWLGYGSMAELEGKSDFDLYSPEHAQPAFDDEQRIIASGLPMFNQEEKEVHPNGNVTWCSTTKMPLRNAVDEVIGTFGVSRDITQRKEIELALERTQAELSTASKLAGIAEVSSGVLHNIGNALNTVVTTTNLVSETMNRSRMANFTKIAQMLKEHETDLAEFLTADAKGKQVPAYLIQLAQVLVSEREVVMGELGQLKKTVEHIKEVVSMQQSYARAGQSMEDIDAVSLMDEAVHISEGSLHRHSIMVKTDYAPVPKVNVSRHKVLQILVNLIRNSKMAMDEAGLAEKQLGLSLRELPNGLVEFAVRDNGVGIPQENMAKLFSFGFTTRKDGHGFGLHASVKAAQEMGGTLTAESEGAGKGACFRLALPAATLG